MHEVKKQNFLSRDHYILLKLQVTNLKSHLIIVILFFIVCNLL